MSLEILKQTTISGLQSQELTDLPSCKMAAAVAKLGRYIYVIGGRNKDGLVLSSVLKFCTYNNTWTTACKINECRANGAAAVLDGEILWNFVSCFAAYCISYLVQYLVT